MKLRWYEKLIIDRVKARKRALTPVPSTWGGGYSTYSGAASNRLTADWHPTLQSANAEINMSLRVLRARSRDLGRNNPYFSNFLALIESNVIGPMGVRMQSQVRKKDNQFIDEVNEKVEAAWSDWGKKGKCDVTGKHSWRDIQRLFVRNIMQDGEALIRLVYQGEYGLQVQFIDPDYLDESYNMPDEGILLSVQTDKYGRPVAYYFLPPTYDYFSLALTQRNAYERIRVPADEVIHGFIPERVGQARGVPKCHSVMNKLSMLNGYEEAELVAARVAAAKMGFYIPPAGDLSLGKDTEVDLLDEVEPGTLMALPEGYDFKPFAPDHPTTAFKDFTKSMLRAIASGLNVSYNTLSVDLEGVSYSSVRQGSLQERDGYKLLQQWVIEHLCQPVFERFMTINWPMLGIPQRYAEQAMEPAWRPRGFDWVDPQKDQQANVIAISNGLACRRDIIAEQGKDFDETIEQLAYEQARIEELDLTLGSVDKVLEFGTEVELADKQAKQADKQMKQQAKVAEDQAKAAEQQDSQDQGDGESDGQSTNEADAQTAGRYLNGSTNGALSDFNH